MEMKMKMKGVMRFLPLWAMMSVVAVPATSAAQGKAAAQPAPSSPSSPRSPTAAADPYDRLEVLHVFQCDMSPGVTEEQVDTIAQQKLKAIRQMPGGEKAKVHVLWPAVVSKMGKTDFQIVWTFPSFADWGRFWDAYEDASALAKADDATEGKVECPDSMLWEAHEVSLPK
jgi:hypothetical protein